jgi:hypothetical protein
MKQVNRREMQKSHELKDIGIDKTKTSRVRIRKIKCQECKTFCIINQHENKIMELICHAKK